MTNPELPQPDTISGEQAHSFMGERVAAWPFETVSDGDNNLFSYHVVRWLYDAYGEGAINYNTKEIDGNEMPAAIQPLISQEWQDETHLTNDNVIRVYSEPDVEYVPPVIPQYDELKQTYVAYTDLFDYIASTPEIYENIKLPTRYTFDGLRVRFEPAYFYRWGIDFRISAHKLAIAPFGNEGHTAQPSEFLLTYHNKVAVLSRTIAELALLAAGHSVHKKSVTTPVSMLNDFDFRLLNIEQVRPDTSEIYTGGGIKELIIEGLIKAGKVNPPNKN